MIKKDLPGRTLDFTFDLSTTPVIGRRGTPEIPGEVGKENKVLSPVGTVDLSTWRKPHLSQVGVYFFVIWYLQLTNARYPFLSGFYRAKSVRLKWQCHEDLVLFQNACGLTETVK